MLRAVWTERDDVVLSEMLTLSRAAGIDEVLQSCYVHFLADDDLLGVGRALIWSGVGYVKPLEYRDAVAQCLQDAVRLVGVVGVSVPFEHEPETWTWRPHELENPRRLAALALITEALSLQYEVPLLQTRTPQIRGEWGLELSVGTRWATKTARHVVSSHVAGR